MLTISRHLLILLTIFTSSSVRCQLSGLPEHFQSPIPLVPDLHTPTNDPDADRSIEQLVHSRGYALETHTVVTDDGYMLAVHRLVPRENYTAATYSRGRKPVIVQHGLFGASTDFLINSPPENHANSNSTYGDTFGFALLATGRYDVWLPNTRGNEYSQQHTRWRRNAQTHMMDRVEYWNFAMDHIALSDLPAVIERVRGITGRETVAYVGYSQGATTMFALLSLRPEYSRIVRPFIAWAPVVYMSHVRSPFRYFAPIASLLQTMGHQFAPSSHLLSQLSHPLCKHLPSFRALCTNALFAFGGADARHLNSTRLPVYYHFTPATVSTWQVVHFLQLIRSGRFARFDYGSTEENGRHYPEQTADLLSPPDYPLKNIPLDAQIVVIRADNDFLASVPDTDRLLAELRSRANMTESRVLDHHISDPDWAHLDFTMGLAAGEILYDPTIEYLDRFA